MPTVPNFGFCAGAYQAITPVLDAEVAINVYVEPGGPNSKSPAGLIGCPGYTLFATLPNGPVRALFAGNGQLYAVGGAHLYRVSSAGASTDLGTLGGATGPAQIAANGNDLIVMDSSVAQVFVTAGGIMVFAFNGFCIDYLDTFYVALSSAVTNQVNTSNSLDGSTWNALNFAVRTGTPDFLTCCKIMGNQLVLLGQKNSELWYNAGNAGFPFQRGSGQSTINQGCSNRFSVVKANNTLQWHSCDDLGSNVIWQLNGNTAVRISTYAIEQLIAQWNPTAEIAAAAGNVRAFTYSEDGHIFSVWNFNGGTGGTVVYDNTTGLWHQRAYLNPGSGVLERIRADCFAAVPGYGPNTTVANLVGDYTNGNIYLQSLATPADNGDPRRYIRTTPHVADRDFWYTYPGLKIDCDIGTATCLLELSDDGGKTFRTTPGGGGAIPTVTPPTGSIPYLQWNQLGRSRDRVMRATITSSTQLIRFIAAYLKADRGNEV